LCGGFRQAKIYSNKITFYIRQCFAFHPAEAGIITWLSEMPRQRCWRPKNEVEPKGVRVYANLLQNMALILAG
jgi:hypothetical protein